MDDYPLTLTEFEEKLATDEACRNYLFKLRWPNGFRCARCENQKAWPISKVHSQCAKCNYQISVIAGTLFHGTHYYLGSTGQKMEQAH